MLAPVVSYLIMSLGFTWLLTFKFYCYQPKAGEEGGEQAGMGGENWRHDGTFSNIKMQQMCRISVAGQSRPAGNYFLKEGVLCERDWFHIEVERVRQTHIQVLHPFCATFPAQTVYLTSYSPIFLISNAEVGIGGKDDRREMLTVCHLADVHNLLSPITCAAASGLLQSLHSSNTVQCRSLLTSFISDSHAFLLQIPLNAHILPTSKAHFQCFLLQEMTTVSLNRVISPQSNLVAQHVVCKGCLSFTVSDPYPSLTYLPSLNLSFFIK